MLGKPNQPYSSYDFIRILVNDGLANFYEKFTDYVVGHPEGVADALGTVSCCQEPQCSSQSEVCWNGFFSVSCQLLYSGCDSLQNLIKCIWVHSEVILEAGNISFLLDQLV